VRIESAGNLIIKVNKKNMAQRVANTGDLN
jgi:hypothetical protein